MGVGTNYFPMKLDLVPKLQTLVSDEDTLQLSCIKLALLRAVGRKKGLLPTPHILVYYSILGASIFFSIIPI